MKKILGLTLCVAALLIFISCGDEVALEAPDLSYTVEDNGATLTITWFEIADADGYYIYADGAVVDTVAVTNYSATTPAAVYGVSAYAGEDESDVSNIDCTPEETTNLTVYGNSDPDPAHPSGIGFNTSGTCVTLAISDSTTWLDIDYFFNDNNPTYGPIDIVSPGDHVPPYNSEDNASSNSGTDYDGLEIADALGDYSTQTALVDGAVFSLWIDPDADGWDDDNDHFGKMSVLSITGAAAPYTVTITVAYQPVAGLRWLVTNP